MHVEKDLGTSRAEFSRNLRVALRGMEYACTGNRIVVEDHGKTIEFRLSPLPPRVLSTLIKLEHWKLTIDFSGYTEAERDFFLDKFNKAFQRGGG